MGVVSPALWPSCAPTRRIAPVFLQVHQLHMCVQDMWSRSVYFGINPSTNALKLYLIECTKRTRTWARNLTDLTAAVFSSSITRLARQRPSWRLLIKVLFSFHVISKMSVLPVYYRTEPNPISRVWPNSCLYTELFIASSLLIASIIFGQSRIQTLPEEASNIENREKFITSEGWKEFIIKKYALSGPTVDDFCFL